MDNPHCQHAVAFPDWQRGVVSVRLDARSVSSATAAGGSHGFGRAANSAISRLVTEGAISGSPAATTRIAWSKLARTNVFEQESARSDPERLVHVLVEVEGREHEHARAGRRQVRARLRRSSDFRRKS
jgi:hypothetical protein